MITLLHSHTHSRHTALVYRGRNEHTSSSIDYMYSQIPNKHGAITLVSYPHIKMAMTELAVAVLNSRLGEAVVGRK